MNNIRKSLSLLLVFAMLICIVPFNVLALNEIGSANAALLQVEDALFDYIDRSEFNRAAYSSRLKHKETASSFVFKSADGTETVYYLADNVKYVDTNGETRIKDLSLVKVNDGFQTASSDITLRASNSVADGVSVVFNDTAVTIAPVIPFSGARRGIASGKSVTYPSALGNGYYSIKSANSGSTAYYLGVKNDSDEHDAQVVLRSGQITDTMMWRITTTTSGGYKIETKAADANDIVLALAVNLLQNSNGVELRQRTYDDNTNYLDEWVLDRSVYGAQTYRSVTSSTVNCHGYALMLDDAPTNWTTQTSRYISTITTYADIEEIKENVSRATRNDFENWLDNNGFIWFAESDFSGNGENNQLNPNQYRVVLRTGIHIINGSLSYDYHFWCQLYDGRWANKHGAAPSELLPSDVTPYTQGTSGWALGSITDFYDGAIYVYIITI